MKKIVKKLSAITMALTLLSTGNVFALDSAKDKNTTLIASAASGNKDNKEAESRARLLLTELGLSYRLEHKPNELSGGEKQRVAAARAMMMQPDVILADEPSGSLDEANKHELHALLLDLRKRFGQTIVIVTHDKELAAISDRTIELVDGRIIN